MPLSLFNRYGIFSSVSTVSLPVTFISFDAQSLSLSNGATVSSITDPNYSATVPVGGATAPTYNSTGINGHPSVSFDTTDMLQTDAVSELLNTSYSMYVVVATSDNTSVDRLFSIASPISTGNGAWVLRCLPVTSGGPGVGSLVGDITSSSRTVSLTSQLQFVIGLRVDIANGHKLDVMALDTPAVRQQDTVFTASATAPHYSYTSAPTIGLPGPNNYVAGNSSSTVQQFGEFRMHLNYLSDVDHEATMQALKTKWQ